jgi:hypothetical protein
MNLPVSTLFEVFLAVLLIVAIVLFWRLERRLSAFRKSQDAMTAAARELNEAVNQAEGAIRGLRKTADEVGRDLQSRIDEARAVARGRDTGRDTGRDRRY